MIKEERAGSKDTILCQQHQPSFENGIYPKETSNTLTHFDL